MEQLRFWHQKRVPVVLQAEAAECGLACLAMVAGYYDHNTSLTALRQKFQLSGQGATLPQLLQIANGVGLHCRAIRAELEGLCQLQLPAVLHWEFNHFVVLVSVRADDVEIIDPAIGKRHINFADVSKHFTGVALELSPAESFVTQEKPQRLKLRRLLGRLPGVKRTAGQILCLAMILELLLLLMPWLTQWVLDDVVVTGDTHLLSLLMLGFILLVIFRIVAEMVRSWLLVVLGNSAKLQLISNLFRHMVSLPYGFFERRHLGDVVSRFDSINVIQRTLTTSFLEAIIDGVMACFTLIMMFVYSWALTLIVVFACLGYLVLRVLLFVPMRQATEDKISRSALQQSHLLETVRGVQTLKLFNCESQRQSQFRNLAVRHFNADISLQKLQILYRVANSFIFSVENILVVGFGALLILQQTFTVGMLFAFMAYKELFAQRAVGLVEKYIELKMLGLHSERVADIALTPTERLSRGVGECSQIRRAPALEVSGLSFSYSVSGPNILQDIHFNIAPGESVAITGASGCGKTTLVKLLLGLLQPASGKIKVDGIAQEDMSVEQYRDLMGAVLQDDQLFTGSLLENICFFDPQPDKEWLIECAKMASIHDDILSFPMGYNTLVGDMGGSLSGGQRQRLLLARALYKRPKMLILDEATSHLDVARELHVNQAVRSLSLTRIIVAHRPETIASADRVLLLQSGRMGPMSQPSKEHYHVA